MEREEAFRLGCQKIYEEEKQARFDYERMLREAEADRSKFKNMTLEEILKFFRDRSEKRKLAEPRETKKKPLTRFRESLLEDKKKTMALRGEKLYQKLVKNIDHMDIEERDEEAFQKPLTEEIQEVKLSQLPDAGGFKEKNRLAQMLDDKEDVKLSQLPDAGDLKEKNRLAQMFDDKTIEQTIVTEHDMPMIDSAERFGEVGTIRKQEGETEEELDKEEGGWKLVVRKSRPKAQELRAPKVVNQAFCSGAIRTVKKLDAGSKKITVRSADVRKLKEAAGLSSLGRISSELREAIQKARLEKKLSQADLAKQIYERPKVVEEYESGKAVLNQMVLQKMESVLGVKLRGKIGRIA